MKPPSKTFTVSFTNGLDDHDFQIIHPDRIAAELEGHRRGWGSFESMPLSWLTLWSHKAIRRTYPDLVPENYDDFAAIVENIVTDPETEDEPDPFPPAAVSDLQ